MYTITRRIEIDAGHRVPTHKSKCQNLHGHRYVIEATCSAASLQPSGEQTSMVLDFGFLKEIMIKHIDEPCDHGMILYVEDPVFLEMFLPTHDNYSSDQIMEHIERDGYWFGHGSHRMRMYVVPFIPTAEELAKHWFERLIHPTSVRSNGLAELSQVKVWETPNCSAVYP